MPRSPTIVSYSCGSRSMNASSAARRAASRTSASDAPGTRVADVLGDRGMQDTRLLVHQRHRATQIVEAERAEIVAVQENRAAVRVEQA